MGAIKTSTGVLSSPARVPIATGGEFCMQQIWSKVARVWYTAEGGGSPDMVQIWLHMVCHGHCFEVGFYASAATSVLMEVSISVGIEVL
ncbi:hypothetical protein RHGRI_020835 [Rhododendron griersonianum]|uniref:Uncharacterized protein n=1 Tax=Rhododendron griersonianum TaxID=479676 RepID=A0AAV6JJ41_9ERIC|nr:hypothetical protein RHGRI_020835 [Rhododendron griersonianum]